MRWILEIILRAFAILISAYVIPGGIVTGFGTAILVAVVLSILNTIVRPILFILTLPITILTLGLFYFILNALMILLVSSLIPGFVVHGLFSALLFSLVLSAVNGVLNAITK